MIDICVPFRLGECVDRVSVLIALEYRQWTHVRTYGTDVFAMDMLSSISQASGDKLMKPMAFYCVFILVLRRLLPDF